MEPRYDAVVVGARCAGSATAMLMARAGLRVLLLDRVHPGRDTLSTHALMRAGVLQLSRWGLLERIVDAGTPPVTGVSFQYADGTESVELERPLYAPRRTVLDTVLLDAAVAAGVTARFGVDVEGVTRSGGRVTGVLTRVRGGGRAAVRAGLTVGADGLRSTVAASVEAPTIWRGAAASALVYGYWPIAAGRYEWFYRPGSTAGVIPTNDGQACVWAGLPAAEFAVRGGPAAVFPAVLAAAAPDVAGRLAEVERAGRLRGFPGAPARLRQAAGPGWALVGDAGSYKDPLTAHGITDALRDAELLARAAVDGSAAAFEHYEQVRDELTVPLLEIAERIAGYGWSTAEIRVLLRAESAAMRPEVAALRALDLPSRRAA